MVSKYAKITIECVAIDPSHIIYAQKMPRLGIEPRTQGFSVPCSTNWANAASLEYVYNTKLKNFRQLFFDKTVHARILLQIFIGAILCK